MRRLPLCLAAVSVTASLLPVLPAASVLPAAPSTLPVRAPVSAGTLATTRVEVAGALRSTTVVVGDLLDRLGGTAGPTGLLEARFETVAATWRSGTAPEVEVRTRSVGGTWSGWAPLEPLADFGELGHGAPRASEPVWVGPSDAVEVRVDHGDPHLLDLILIDPGEDPPEDTEDPAEEALDPAYRKKKRHPNAKHAPMPEIRTRKQWGANERWAKGGRVFNETIKQVHVHHTAGSTDYARADVPGILRAVYWYHTKRLGWSDVGYNFLVDRFGRIWEGRGGGVRHRVRGAHTLGFNHASAGVAAIGNFESARAQPPMLRAIARLAAWKLDKHGRNPAARTRVRSEGSDRYPRGRRVRLPVIDGHRDTNETACPGRTLQASLPWIRRRAAERAESYGPPRA